MFIKYLFSYLLFIMEIFTFFVVLFFIVFGLTRKKVSGNLNQLKVTSLNNNFEQSYKNIARIVFSKNLFKKRFKSECHKNKKIQLRKGNCKRIFVIKFLGDINASQVTALSKEIDSIIAIANSNDEIFLRLESPGGSVTGYGLAAVQLSRIKDRGIFLTVSVDKIAASGGYMMASVADLIICSPFAILGSIGVVAQLPNINRFLSDKGIDIELHTAGRYKRTLTLLGKNTDKGRQKFSEDLKIVHKLFKDHLRAYRPKLDIDLVSTGEYWYGKTALSLKLVDKLLTGDEYLLEKYKTYDYQMFAVEYKTSSSKLYSAYKFFCKYLIRSNFRFL